MPCSFNGVFKLIYIPINHTQFGFDSVFLQSLEIVSRFKDFIHKFFAQKKE